MCFVVRSTTKMGNFSRGTWALVSLVFAALTGKKMIIVLKVSGR